MVDAIACRPVGRNESRDFSQVPRNEKTLSMALCELHIIVMWPSSGGNRLTTRFVFLRDIDTAPSMTPPCSPSWPLRISLAHK